MDGLIIDREEVTRERKEAIIAKRVDTDIDFDRVMVGMLGNVGPVLHFARTHQMLTPQSDAAIRRLAKGDIRLTTSERNSLKFLLGKIQKAGFELQT
jgi:ribosomal protein S2